MGKKAILVASNQPEVIQSLTPCLGDEYRVEVSSGWGDTLEAFKRLRYEFTFLDLALLQQDAPSSLGSNYKKALQTFRDVFPTAHIIIVTHQNHTRDAVKAVREGASDYLAYPLDPIEVKYVMDNVTEQHTRESELVYLRERFFEDVMPEGEQTNSPLMMEALEKVHSVAPTKTTVLLTGETGTGKGVVAKLIHRYSNREKKPFIPIHCGAIPETLIESELFGHEKGAFTGATRRKMGKFQIADGGTIFLDEIATISPSMQIKLLQVLQEKSIARVGGEVAIDVDVRVIAATNMDLKDLCQQGLFRKDLFYRLNVFPIDLPPLRQRTEDVSLLTDIFLEKLNKAYGKEVKGLAPTVLEALKQYSWPGNIRELENLIERAYILEKKSTLATGNFPAELFAHTAAVKKEGARNIPSLSEIKQRAMDSAEKNYLENILKINKGRVDHSAAVAGVTPRQLRNLLTKHGLRKEDFK